jgi:HD-like signal output (HDOD) protein
MSHTLARLEAEALAAVHKLGIPPCPQVLADIGRELRGETPDAQKVGNLVTHDASCSAGVLKTVNSPYYGLATKARSVQQAIGYLGVNRTCYLLAGLLLRNAFPTAAKRSMVRFWDTSTQLALTAAYLARVLGQVDREEAHTFGLFRDVGTAVLICKFADYDDVLIRAEGAPTARITALEQGRYGTDHAVIGAVLARDWQLPEEMSEAVLWHHAEFVFELDDCPIPDAALRFIALGMLADRILESYAGKPAQPLAAAMQVLDVPTENFPDLEAGAIRMLDEIAIAPAPTLRLDVVGR